MSNARRRFGDPLVLALFSVLLLFRLLPRGFRSRDLREHIAPLLGQDPSSWTQGRLTYQLRRLRLHGLIERVPQSQRYQVTERGLAVALWFTRSHARLFRPALGNLLGTALSSPSPLRRALEQFEAALDRHVDGAHLTPTRSKKLD